METPKQFANRVEVVSLANIKQISSLNSLIEKVTENSDHFIKRLRVHFKNSYQVSIIFGMGTYGSKQGLYEIAVFDRSGNYHTKRLGTEDDVIGYLTPDEVVSYMFQVGSW